MDGSRAIAKLILQREGGGKRSEIAEICIDDVGWDGGRSINRYRVQQ